MVKPSSKTPPDCLTLLDFNILTDSIRHTRDDKFKQRERDFLSFIRDFSIDEQDPELFKIMKNEATKSSKQVYNSIFDNFESSLPEDSEDRFVVQGSKVPLLTLGPEKCRGCWGYIDDFGFLGLRLPGVKEGTGVLREHYAASGGQGGAARTTCLQRVACSLWR